MRLFVAIPIPPDVQARARELLDALRPLAAIRWERGDGFHVTTKFIGEVAPEAARDIEVALTALGHRPPMRLRIRGTGWFPGPVGARVFWAGVEAPPALAALAADTDRALSRLNVPPETRPYAPHVTLARVPPGASLGALQRWLRAEPPVEVGAFEADHLALYESRAVDGETRHEVRVRVPLSG